MEREIVFEIKDEVTEERLDYLARFFKQATLEFEELKGVYVVRRNEQEDWRL